MRPNGNDAEILAVASENSSPKARRRTSVSKGPGQMALTLIGANSTAMARAKDSRPAVATAPAERPARGRTEEIPEQKTKEP